MDSLEQHVLAMNMLEIGCACQTLLRATTVMVRLEGKPSAVMAEILIVGTQQRNATA
jgi:hypothetical protein